MMFWLILRLLWNYIVRKIYSAAVFVIEAWKDAWKALFRFLQSIAYSAFHPEFILPFMLAIMLLSPFILRRIIIADNVFTTIHCTNPELSMTIYTPRLILPEETEQFYVIIHNTSRIHSYKNIRITLVEPSGAIEFPHSNYFIAQLAPLETRSASISFRLLQHTSPKIRISAFADGQFSTCQPIIKLRLEKGYRLRIFLAKILPDFADTLAKIIGYVTPVLIAILSLFDKWASILTKLKQAIGIKVPPQDQR